jgi:hypothetical protein
MFPNCQDLIDMIPDPSNMSPTKLLGGTVSTDMCNTAQLTRQTLCKAIIQEGRDAGLDNKMLKMYQGNCHQHLHKILVDAGANHPLSKLSELLCNDLAIIPHHLHVTCKNETFYAPVISSLTSQQITRRGMAVCFMLGWRRSGRDRYLFRL